MVGIIEQLVHSTVRIECHLADGSTACGTGFIMNFEFGEAVVPILVTNKHVVEGAVTGGFYLSTFDAAGKPDLTTHEQLTAGNFEKAWIHHQDPDVDLAIFPIGPLLNASAELGKKLFYTPLSMSLIPTHEQKDELSAMEDIIMLGYPNGIWDTKHNLPVIRKGITATHCARDFDGEREFLTDIASFPGSSGSPVFLANLGVYANRDGSTVIGNRVYLLGIHCAGAVQSTHGELKLVKAPTNAATVPITDIPINIGVVINSSRILEFEPIIKKRAGL